MEICLIIDLDKNKKIPAENAGILSIFYEQEAVKCVQAWRKNAGWLKDIDIYGIINKNVRLNDIIYKRLDSFGVKIIEDDKTYSHKFLNTVNSQLLFENNEKYDYVIHIDLDLYLLKEIPKDLFNDKVVLCRYTDNNMKNTSQEFIHRYNNVKICHNTFFIINPINSNFFKTLSKYINDKNYLQFFKDKILYNNDYYFFEEGLYDFITEYNLYPENKILHLDSNIIDSIYFQHRHLTIQDILAR